MEYDIFISYSKKDTSKIKHLREALSKTDIKYWIDDYIGGSKKWLKEIPIAIQGCKILLFVASQNSASSEWTQKEILYAQKLDKEIYPFKLTDFSFESCPELDFFFTNVQWRENIDDVIEDLLAMTGRRRLNSVDAESKIVSDDVVKFDAARKAKEEAERKAERERFAKIYAERVVKEKAERDAYLLGLPDDEFKYFFDNYICGFKLKSSGEVVIPLKYKNAESFCEGLARVKLNGKYGFIDKTGKEVIPLKYDNAWSFREGLAGVELNGKHGFIDKTGKEVIPFKYDYAWSFSEGLASVKLNGKYGFIDKTGKEVIFLKYDKAWPFTEGLAIVKLNGKWGYIDKTGKEVIPFKYDNAWPFTEGLAGVELNGKWGYIDKIGKEIIPCKYIDARGFNGGKARVKKRDFWGNEKEFYIDKNGNKIE